MPSSTILGSRAQRAVLARLLLKPDERFYLRQIVRLTGFSLRTIQVVLDRLVEEDLLIDERDGNRRYFQANTHHPFFPPLRDLFLRSEGLTEVLAESLGQAGIQSAVVFGSIAEGTATADSDVDLLVIGEIGLKEVVKRLAGTADKIGREVNPIVWTRDEFQKRFNANDHFLKSVLDGERLVIVGDSDDLG